MTWSEEKNPLPAFLLITHPVDWLNVEYVQILIYSSNKEREKIGLIKNWNQWINRLSIELNRTIALVNEAY